MNVSDLDLDVAQMMENEAAPREALERQYLFGIGIAEVMGSNNPTRSISFILGTYGIKLSLFLMVVGQNSLAMPMPSSSFVLLMNNDLTRSYQLENGCANKRYLQDITTNY